MALTTLQEYNAVREAIQQLTTLDSYGERRDTVSISVEGMSLTYNSSQIQQLQEREKELLRRLSRKNVRKRVTPDFS